MPLWHSSQNRSLKNHGRYELRVIHVRQVYLGLNPEFKSVKLTNRQTSLSKGHVRLFCLSFLGLSQLKTLCRGRGESETGIVIRLRPPALTCPITHPYYPASFARNAHLIYFFVRYTCIFYPPTHPWVRKDGFSSLVGVSIIPLEPNKCKGLNANLTLGS